MVGRIALAAAIIGGIVWLSPHRRPFGDTPTIASLINGASRSALPSDLKDQIAAVIGQGVAKQLAAGTTAEAPARPSSKRAP